MIVEIQHETRLQYSAAVAESITEVRMEPMSSHAQSCRSFHLGVAPYADVFRYHDGFGNTVHHFNLLAPHKEVQILAASLVETHPTAIDVSASKALLPIAQETLDLEMLDYLGLRGPVRPSPLLIPVLEQLRGQPGMRVMDFVFEVTAYISQHYEYAREVTLATSSIDDVLSHGKGVCQDFTHLMLAVLRTRDVPARYVSGYIHRPDKQSQSHAWCEAYVPDLGWVGIDPTNNCLVNDHFIKVAVGRDFTDVTPNKGIYRGNAREAISVRVETRELDSLPSLSWQEQLPPLEVPLTEIVSRRAAHVDGTELHQQQQQQQQQQ